METFKELSLSHYLAELSSEKPVPGGGSVSAYVAALAMGLGLMVGKIGGKKVLPASQPKLKEVLEGLEKMKREALEIVDLDPKVYQELIDTYAQVRSVSDAREKEKRIDGALRNAFRLQADLSLLIVMAREAVRTLDEIIPKGSIKNDLKVSRSLLEASFHGAWDTAQINVVYLKDPEIKKEAEKALQELERRFTENAPAG